MYHFNEYPENQYLMMCLCAHCGGFMMVHLEKNNLKRCRCLHCKKRNRFEGIQHDEYGYLTCDVFQVND